MFIFFLLLFRFADYKLSRLLSPLLAYLGYCFVCLFPAFIIFTNTQRR